MRIFVLVLMILGCFTHESCATTRLSRIHPGMTRTDVAIELGKPLDIRIDGDATLWVYPSSESQICIIKFIDQKVVQEPMKCDNSEDSRKLAGKSLDSFATMNSELEYKGRLERYCGMKPIPRTGCKISEQCINGGWEEICPPAHLTANQ
jgi:hypothetical protein